MANLNKWKILQSNMALNHPWCKVRRDEVELPNGQVIDDYFVYLKPDVAIILPITSNQEVVFVKQYRHAIGDFFIELPAGGFNPETESGEVAAVRELEEETGYIASQIKKIATFYDKPSKDTNQLHLYVAENVVQTGKIKFDITEEIEVILIPIDAVLQKIIKGEISVAGTVAALFLGLNLVK
ncbi:MAG: NUDIX hydrolase [Richelia sp. RM2_1_2]|nr:NUDIX hydrolase [Richelia sp. SM2_1_7]NJM21700.1 NUDIX hydrolase [Richelia sp. SM1_7_0]NJN06763.1 NUDIX hydrolase [Richelia sp. RM1_1_1]NJO28075.1 NUDIX hydrolase [Richelia sp. SL_2_1]NJO59999.1 NUDIX hydrolase [Richelia sp. RM2_1_2]